MVLSHRYSAYYDLLWSRQHCNPHYLLHTTTTHIHVTRPQLSSSLLCDVIVNVSFYLPVLIEHAALIMATAHEMRKSRRDQLNPIEVISVVASDGCAAAAADLLFLWPTANIVLVASCIYLPWVSVCVWYCTCSSRHAPLDDTGCVCVLRPFTRNPTEELHFYHSNQFIWFLWATLHFFFFCSLNTRLLSVHSNQVAVVPDDV